jgi:fructose-1,6-bisphosphatase I
MKVVLGLALLVASTCAFLPRVPSPAKKSSSLLAHTKTNKAPVFDEVCETTGVTLKRFMLEVALLNPDLVELTILFSAIEFSCKAIANLVRRSHLPSAETLGYSNDQENDPKVRCFPRPSPSFVLFSLLNSSTDRETM